MKKPSGYESIGHPLQDPSEGVPLPAVPTKYHLPSPSPASKTEPTANHQHGNMKNTVKSEILDPTAAEIGEIITMPDWNQIISRFFEAL